jgi:RNA polymerase sigma-70 factor, ECF subfamily
MIDSGQHQLTLLLRAWAEGDQQALEQITPRVYDELHRLARRYMADERPNHPLQPTALINEAFIRLIDWKDAQWQGRTHFFAMAATVMRRVLVDLARKRDQLKRGGGFAVTTFDDAMMAQQTAASHDLVALDDALTRLETMDPRKGRVVELRFFAGLSVEETASALQLSERTVKREWNFARAWLRLQIEQ